MSNTSNLSKEGLRKSYSVGSFVEIVAKSVALGVPILYATGRIYSEAYWDELRIPLVLLEYSVPDYIYLGFFAIASGIANAVGLQISSKLIYIALFAVCIGAVAVVASLIYPRIESKIREGLMRAAHLARTSLDGEAGRHIALFGAVSSFLFALVYFLFLTALLLLLPVALIARSGEEAGKRQREYQSSTLIVYEHGRPPKPRMRAHYTQDEKLEVARLVNCGGSWCIVFTAGAFIAIPMQSVRRIDQEPLPSIGN